MTGRFSEEEHNGAAVGGPVMLPFQPGKTVLLSESAAGEEVKDLVKVG